MSPLALDNGEINLLVSGLGALLLQIEQAGASARDFLADPADVRALRDKLQGRDVAAPLS